jgi:hypothetical protein
MSRIVVVIFMYFHHKPTNPNYHVPRLLLPVSWGDSWRLSNDCKLSVLEPDWPVRFVNALCSKPTAKQRLQKSVLHKSRRADSAERMCGPRFSIDLQGFTDGYTLCISENCALSLWHKRAGSCYSGENHWTVVEMVVIWVAGWNEEVAVLT